VESPDLVDVISNPEEYFQREKYMGVYYGLVEDNVDPRRLNRLKIRTPVNSDVEAAPTEALPWAPYASPFGGDKDIGFYAVPTIGSQVVVSFIDGDPIRPVYLGAVWAAPEDKSETFVYTLEDSQPDEWDFTKHLSLRTPYGHMMEFDDNVDVGGDSYARITLITPESYYLRMSEKVDEKHLELHTNDNRNFILDDTNETCKLTTPDGHFFEVSSVDDFIRAETEDGIVLVMDDPSNSVDLFTPGFNAERGMRLFLDEPNKRALIKGIDNDYCLEFIENTRHGLYNQFLFPITRRSAIAMTKDSGKDILHMTLGLGIENGVIVTPTLTGKPSEVMFATNGRFAPDHSIRLVLDGNGSTWNTGDVFLGSLTGANWIKMKPQTRAVEVQCDKLDLLALNSIRLGHNFQGSEEIVTIKGPFLSTYFKHTHEVSLLLPTTNIAANWHVLGTAGSTPLLVQQAAPLKSSKVRVDGSW
jgi:hypothetical protein